MGFSRGWSAALAVVFAATPAMGMTRAEPAPARDAVALPAPVPQWTAPPLPDLRLEPDCKGEVENPAEDFDVALRRGVRLAYASPITVSAWRSPESACRRLNASARFNVSRFRWRRWDLVRESLRRVHYEADLSYVWQYDSRYTLQRLEPGVLFSGSFEDLPAVRLYLDVRFANHWHLRVEDALRLARLDAPDWRARMDYTF